MPTMSELLYHESPDSTGSGVSPGATIQTEDSSHVHDSMISETPLTRVDSTASEKAVNNLKTDKPRPHVCATCQRSFARLEHLKRHERSHTKEKPFECPECARCFARRDLLLRHQQKLHMNVATTARPKSNRRESTSSLAANPSGRVRKNSVANAGLGVASGRPRANTLSHLDANFFSSSHAVKDNGTSKSQQPDVIQVAYSSHSRAASDATSLLAPRLTTHGLNSTLGGMRTAPVKPEGFSFDQYFGQSTTINPAQLHVDEAIKCASTPFMHQFTGGLQTATSIMDDEDGFDWMQGFNSQMNFGSAYEQAIAESSPSVMSAVSQAGFGQGSMDGRKASVQSAGFGWHTGLGSHSLPAVPPFVLEDGLSSFHEFATAPESLLQKNYNNYVPSLEMLYPTPPHISSVSPIPVLSALGADPHLSHLPTFGTDGSSESSGSVNGASRHSSATSTASCVITDLIREALLMNLQPVVTDRKPSQPQLSSPLLPQVGNGSETVSLPSTADLQRYINAYIIYFHPHLPFLHISTLLFDSPVYTASIRLVNGFPGLGEASLIGGGGCLILAMAAIGALYEFDRAVSKELFNSARWLIRVYLEERRNTATPFSGGGSSHDTPIWLVQAMLLNIIYGHNCGDKLSSDIASTHCAALVSLARAAELTKPLSDGRTSVPTHTYNSNGDIHMTGDVDYQDMWTGGQSFADDEADWHRWIDVEERKRTLFAIFHLSSLLVSAYNHAPALMNSEIQLDLPCDEELWNADSASVWTLAGRTLGASQRAIPFVSALSNLLGADMRLQQAQPFVQPFGYEIPVADVPLSDLRPSTFGCLVLINALHNYIWETRQRHSGRQWTTQRTDAMHAHIEPALRAWQAAWASNPAHSLERPNAYGPLSADCIPLLDLAYVRLFVNLGQSKEAFWQRDFDAMAEELARGSEIVQHADNSNDESDRDSGRTPETDIYGLRSPMQDETPGMRHAREQQKLKTKREHHLRKAAHYAADSLSMSDKLGVTFAEFTSRELPVQSAMCAFDCAQVLAEWVATVQERVGRYLGIVGRDDIDYGQVPAIMLLQDEDCKLLEKIASILINAEEKMAPGGGASGYSSAAFWANAGYGSKVLIVTACMLERAAVWPVTSLMAQSLQTQAAHMNKRAEASISQ